MRLNIRITAWLALLLAALVAGTAVADDRNFLRQLAAPPNLIFILDTSRSMVGSPEEPGKVNNALVKYGMVPGGGDDPYSRMGIAKRVLREFLTDVTDANYVLAGYAQAPPTDGSNPIPTKHWVYEGIGYWDSALSAYRPDRFHLMEQGYAYRFGYAETYAGLALDNPADIYQGQMMGYTPYFDPALGSAGVANRFGPARAIDADPTLPYDLMPVYFGTCIFDDKNDSDPANDETFCGDGVFPFFDTGERDASSNMIIDDWYYDESGRFPDCVPWKSESLLDPDDGCLSHWFDNTGTVPGHMSRMVEFKRRVRLEIPATNPNTGLDNHPLGELDPDGIPMSGDEVAVGNELINDLGTEDYDLDGSTDRDYDEDMAYDWVLYVDAVEQLTMRECGAPRTPTPSQTPTDTATPVPPTDTPTETPTTTPTPTETPIVPTATPTPITVDCADMRLTNALKVGPDGNPGQFGTINMDVGNYTPFTGYMMQTTITWADTQAQASNPYIDDIRFEGNCGSATSYWTSPISTAPALVVPPYSAGGSVCTPDSNVSVNPGDTRADWFAYLNSGEAWVGEVCVQLDFYFPDDPDLQTCIVQDCVTLPMGTPTPTPTPTITPTPSNTYTPSNTRPPTNTFTPRPPTNTFTPRPPTKTFTPRPPTNTPRPATKTFTPRPATKTFTPRPPTNTPVPPTKTPVPPTATNTPKEIE